MKNVGRMRKLEEFPLTVEHKFPSVTKDCIVSNAGICKFFTDSRKNEKAVFIAAPNRLKPLVEVVKSVVKEHEYEPVVATDFREYNRSAFCTNICRPMLEAWVTVVIGDWRGNKGNANVAFEYGIATALGCEVVPVRLDNRKGSPFDMSGLHSIIVRKGTDGQWDMKAFEQEFREYFEKSKSKMELLKQELKLTQKEKARLNELLAQFSISRTSADRRTAMAVLKKFSQLHPVNRDYEFVQQMANVAVKYAHICVGKAERVGTLTKECLDENFFSVLEGALMPNLANPACATVNDSQFHGALAALARQEGVPLFARATAVNLLLRIAASVDNGDLLKPVFDVIQSEKLSSEDYEKLAIPNRLVNYVDSVISRDGNVRPMLEGLSGLRDIDVPLVQARVDYIDHVLKA
ncbi:MAG TPA: hypothetical protein VF374_00130 [Thermoplasmata archaeon]